MMRGGPWACVAVLVHLLCFDAFAAGEPAAAVDGGGLARWEPEGPGGVAERDLQGGRFACSHCNSSRDCGVVASRGHQQKDLAWRLWRSDGHYVNTKEKDVRLCIRKWMAGCNGPRGPAICNLYTEVCTPSQAAFDPAHRTAPHEICSSQAFMSPASVTLIITIPAALCLVSLVAVIATLHHSFSNGYYQCPPSIDHMPVLLSSACLIVFSFLTFFSPYFSCGVVGMSVGILAIIAHTVTTAMHERLHSDHLHDVRDVIDHAKRWLLAAAVTTVALVCVVYMGLGVGGQTVRELERECTEYYGFFVIDERLVPPGHDPLRRHWGYCDRDYLEDTQWNVRAVFCISLVLGGIHVHTLRSLSARHAAEEEDEGYLDPVPGTVAGGPTAFLHSHPRRPNRYASA